MSFGKVGVKMGVNYNFKKAEKIISELSPDDLITLEKICREIQAAENALIRKAEENLVNCLDKCEGLCCRNILPYEIISIYDFIYILTVQNSMHAEISKCLENEDTFFPADCIFLADGKGPCIFPPNARAAICITTFCNDEAPIKKEICQTKLVYSNQKTASVDPFLVKEKKTHEWLIGLFVYISTYL